MKVRIDTEKKTLAIEEPANFKELLKFIKALFPDEWEKWKIETNVVFDFSPTIIRDTYPWRPWPQVWYGVTGGEYTMLSSASVESGTVTNNGSPQFAGETQTVHFLEVDNLN